MNNDGTEIGDFLKLYSEKTIANTIVKSGLEIKFALNPTSLHADYKIIQNLFSETDLVVNTVTINLNKCNIVNCYFFFDLKDYLIKYDNYKNDYLNSEIIILNHQGSSLKKDKSEEFSEEKSLFFNFPTYKELYNYLKENPLFTAMYGEINSELIIVNKNNGAFHIGYKHLEERVSSLDNIEPLFKLLKNNFEKKEFIQFFKENITVFGIGNFDSQDRFFEIVKNLKPLMLLTERDYENYVSDFSFENIKTKFKEERNKYFEGLEKNIELVSKQVVSIPLSFAATAFASYQVRDKPVIVILILIGFFLYSIIAFKLLGISEFNTKCIKKDVEKEEKEIKNNYLKNYDHFKSDFKKINLKILKINGLIVCIKSILVIMLSLFVLFSLFQFFSSNDEKKEVISVDVSNLKYIVVDTLHEKKINLNEINKVNKEHKDTILTKIIYPDKSLSIPQQKAK